MKLRLLALLACPSCRGELGWGTLRRFPGTDGEVKEGALVCKGCGQDYPITGGVPRLRPPQKLERRADKTRRAFGWEWLRYPGSRPQDRGIFLEETMLEPAQLRGKLVLDAGCGMGRYSAVALALGAEVVAVDLSESLQRVAERAETEPNLHPVEADLLHPPFKPGVFDVAYSQGVLHHTSDTRAAFAATAALLKPGGLFSVWLYGKAGRFADFATNPIKAGRAGLERHRRAAWLLVGARHCVSDFLRFFTTRLPVRVVYALCFPLAALGAVPGLKHLTFSVDPDFQARVIENFDWLSPPYQWHHTKEELAEWYRRAGFSVLKFLPHGLVPKPGALGQKRS